VTPRNLTILLLLLAAVLALGCGADSETKPSIPPATAQTLEGRLSEIQRRFDVGGGACNDITTDSRPAVEATLASLPPSVDKDVRSALIQSFDRLFELTAEQCDNQSQTDTTPTTATTETQTTDTTETQTTDTTPTETIPTDTTPTTETTPPPAQDNGNGNGNGNGNNGNGNGNGGGGAQGPGL
jgi:hypothetical protein